MDDDASGSELRPASAEAVLQARPSMESRRSTDPFKDMPPLKHTASMQWLPEEVGSSVDVAWPEEEVSAWQEPVIVRYKVPEGFSFPSPSFPFGP